MRYDSIFFFFRRHLLQGLLRRKYTPTAMAKCYVGSFKLFQSEKVKQLVMSFSFGVGHMLSCVWTFQGHQIWESCQR